MIFGSIFVTLLMSWSLGWRISLWSQITWKIICQSTKHKFWLSYWRRMCICNSCFYRHVQGFWALKLHNEAKPFDTKSHAQESIYQIIIVEFYDGAVRPLISVNSTYRSHKLSKGGSFCKTNIFQENLGVFHANQFRLSDGSQSIILDILLSGKWTGVQ